MNIPAILIVNYPNSIWALTGDSYDGLEWLDESPKPTEAELQSQWADVQYQVSYDAVTVARQTAYSAVGGSDGIFFKYQRGEATEQEWLDAVTAINDANPYPVKAKK